MPVNRKKKGNPPEVAEEILETPAEEPTPEEAPKPRRGRKPRAAEAEVNPVEEIPTEEAAETLVSEEQDTEGVDQELESEEDLEARTALLEEAESVFGNGFETEENPDEDEEESQEEGSEQALDSEAAPFLNCAEFRLVKIEREADRLFGFKFTADSIKGESEWNQMPEDPGQTPFEEVFEEIGKLILPKVFPNQAKLQLSCIVRNTKQVKKQPVTFVCFEASNQSGLVGSTSKSEKIPIDRLGEDFVRLFNELENKVHEELRERRNKYKQTTLDFDDEEDIELDD